MPGGGLTIPGLGPDVSWLKSAAALAGGSFSPLAVFFGGMFSPPAIFDGVKASLSAMLEGCETSPLPPFCGDKSSSMLFFGGKSSPTVVSGVFTARQQSWKRAVQQAWFNRRINT